MLTPHGSMPKALSAGLIALIVSISSPAAALAAPRTDHPCAEQAQAHSNCADAGRGSHARAKKHDPLQGIAKAKAADPVGFAHRVEVLRQSDALMVLFDGAPASSVSTYVEFFASTVNLEGAEAFVQLTAGKHFVNTGTDSSPDMVLIDGAPVRTSAATYGYKCWQAYVAAYSWFAATSAICGAATVLTAEAGGAGGVACALAFWGVSSLPNWNDACH